MFYAISSPVLGIVALMCSYFLYSNLSKQNITLNCNKDIMIRIKKGTASFFIKQIIKLMLPAILVFVFMMRMGDEIRAYSYLAGVIIALIIGLVGIIICNKNGEKTIGHAKECGINSCIGFLFGMGHSFALCCVGVILFAIGQIYLILLSFGYDLLQSAQILTSFMFGVSIVVVYLGTSSQIYIKSVVAGGIIIDTLKCDDVNKVENSLLIVKNIGNTINSIFSSGFDYLQSYIGSILAAITFGVLTYGFKGAVYPIALCACAVIVSLVMIYFTKYEDKSNKVTLKFAMYIAFVVILAFAYLLSTCLLATQRGFYCVLIGILIVVMLWEFFKSRINRRSKLKLEFKKGFDKTDYNEIKNIDTLSFGMSMGVFASIIIVIGIYLSFKILGFYGISLASSGLVCMIPNVIAVSIACAGADNAMVTAKACEVDERSIKIIEDINDLVSPFEYFTKCISIVTSAIISTSLILVYMKYTKLNGLGSSSPTIIVGLLIGFTIPFLLSVINMRLSIRNIKNIGVELKKQCRYSPDLLKERYNFNKYTDMLNKSVSKESCIAPLIAIIFPIMVGVLFGVNVLAGVLIGEFISGYLLSMTILNMDEAGGIIDVVSTSLNIFIKIMIVVSIVFLPIIMKYGGIFLEIIKN